MDSDWDSESFSAGTLVCVLCKDTLEFKNGDTSNFVHHLMDVHQVKYHHNLILSVTFLDNTTLGNIIKQFEEHAKSVGGNIDLTDGGFLEENSESLTSC